MKKTLLITALVILCSLAGAQYYISKKAHDQWDYIEDKLNNNSFMPVTFYTFPFKQGYFSSHANVIVWSKDGDKIGNLDASINHTLLDSLNGFSAELTGKPTGELASIAKYYFGNTHPLHIDLKIEFNGDIKAEYQIDPISDVILLDGDGKVTLSGLRGEVSYNQGNLNLSANTQSFEFDNGSEDKIDLRNFRYHMGYELSSDNRLAEAVGLIEFGQINIDSPDLFEICKDLILRIELSSIDDAYKLKTGIVASSLIHRDEAEENVLSDMDFHIIFSNIPASSIENTIKIINLTQTTDNNLEYANLYEAQVKDFLIDYAINSPEISFNAKAIYGASPVNIKLTAGLNSKGISKENLLKDIEHSIRKDTNLRLSMDAPKQFWQRILEEQGSELSIDQALSLGMMKEFGNQLSIVFLYDEGEASLSGRKLTDEEFEAFIAGAFSKDSENNVFGFNFENKCKHPLILAIRYQDVDGAWRTEGTWSFKPGESAYLTDENGIRLKTSNAVWYYYAETTDDTNFVWKGDHIYTLGGDSLPMIRLEDTDGDSNWYTTCE